MTLAGVDTNYLVSIQAPNNLYVGVGSNLVFQAWGSNGTVWVKALNLSAGAVDPASIKFTVTARQTLIHGQ
jgi:hypothetical protein